MANRGRLTGEACPVERIDPRRLWRGLPAALGAAGHVDRVELKAIIDVRLEDAMALLSVDVLPPMLRRIHYLDTPDLRLSGRGIVVRVRETRCCGAAADADVVVKLRRAQRGRRRHVAGLRIELDALPASTTWSASARRTLPVSEARAGVAADTPAARLLDGSQRRLLKALAGPDIELDELVAHGPVQVVRLRSAEAGNRVCIEEWRFPDGSRLVELSVKCRPERAARVVAAVRTLIGKRRIAVPGLQATKTQFALRALSGRRQTALSS